MKGNIWNEISDQNFGLGKYTISGWKRLCDKNDELGENCYDWKSNSVLMCYQILITLTGGNNLICVQ